MPTSFVGPFFSYPYNAQGEVEDLLMDATVHVKLAQLFGGVTRSTKVRGAIYIWRYEDFEANQSQMYGPSVSSPRLFTQAVSQALLRTRTHDARFLVDQNYMTDETRGAFADLNLSVTEDENSLGGGGIMHSKFFLFSSLRFSSSVRSGFPRRMDYVVAITSANIDNEMYRAANNLVIMHSNRKLYTTFLTLWQYILENPEATAADATSTSCDDVYVYTFPRDGDTIAGILDKIDDQMDTDGVPPRIRVAMYLFSRETVRDKLVALAERGADVKVVLSSFNHRGEERNREIEDFLDDHGVSSRLLPNRSVGVMHSKYMIVDAQYEIADVVTRRHIVWTGSHNYTGDALEENDEVLVRLTNAAVFDAYMADWNRLWELAGL